MSLNKIIIGFIVILIVFSAFIIYQTDKKNIPTSKVTIASHTFSVNVATTDAQRQQGLSGVPSLPQDQGMLFIFKTADKYPFWMKDMKFPLDMIYINNNKIVYIFQNVPTPKTSNTADLPIYVPTEPATQVLEINANLAKAYNFKKGDSVTEIIK